MFIDHCNYGIVHSHDLCSAPQMKSFGAHPSHFVVFRGAPRVVFLIKLVAVKENISIAFLGRYEHTIPICKHNFGELH